jgi:antitoxin component YwqK of YwqJK toxin-antitoxin module
LCIVILFFSSRAVFSQIFFNYKDIKGKKQGYWIERGQEDDKQEYTYLRYYVNDKQKVAWLYKQSCKCIVSKYTECCIESYYEATNSIKSKIEYLQKEVLQIKYFRNGRTSSIYNFATRSLFGYDMVLQGHRYDSLGYKIEDEYFIKEIVHTYAQKKMYSKSVEDYESNGYIHEKRIYRQGVLQMKSFTILFLGKYENFSFPYGIWLYFSEKGKLIKEEFYDKGKLIKTKEHKP